MFQKCRLIDSLSVSLSLSLSLSLALSLSLYMYIYIYIYSICIQSMCVCICHINAVVREQNQHIFRKDPQSACLGLILKSENFSYAYKSLNMIFTNYTFIFLFCGFHLIPFHRTLCHITTFVCICVLGHVISQVSHVSI